MKTVITKAIHLEPIEINFTIKKCRGTYTATLMFIEEDEESKEQSFIKVELSQNDLDNIKRKIDEAYKN